MRALLLLAALCALAAGGCGSSDETSPAPPTTTPSTPQTSAREPAPAISGETLDGETVSLGDFRGKPVFVNVWSSW